MPKHVRAYVCWHQYENCVSRYQKRTTKIDRTTTAICSNCLIQWKSKQYMFYFDITLICIGGMFSCGQNHAYRWLRIDLRHSNSIFLIRKTIKIVSHIAKLNGHKNQLRIPLNGAIHRIKMTGLSVFIVLICLPGS